MINFFLLIHVGVQIIRGPFEPTQIEGQSAHDSA